MKYLGVCLQRLPREGRFYRHQTSSQLQPTFRPEVAGAPERAQEPGAAIAHLPVGLSPAFLPEARPHGPPHSLSVSPWVAGHRHHCVSGERLQASVKGGEGQAAQRAQAC